MIKHRSHSGIVRCGGEQTECPMLDNIMTPINYRRGRHRHRHGHLPQLTPQMGRCRSLPTWPGHAVGWVTTLCNSSEPLDEASGSVAVVVQGCELPEMDSLK